MKKIETPEDIIAAAARVGAQVAYVEAEIVLSVLDVQDYTLLIDDEYTLILHDNQNGENDSYDENTTLRDVVDLCLETTREVLLDAIVDCVEKSYISGLQKDVFILEALMQNIGQHIPPTLKEYDILIVEHLRKKVTVDAASYEEAKQKVEDAWNRGDYILDADNFASVMFTLAQ